jgi:Ca2+-binding RTX toxin-like protein
MSTQTVKSANSGLVFNNTYTANCTQDYINCVVAAETQFQGLFSNSDTINMTFDEQAQGNTGNLASNSWSSWDFVSYDQLKAALPASDDLPDTDPTSGHNWALPEAYARMLGLSTFAPATMDDTVTLNSSYSWNFGQDVTNTIEHEITEGAMGRVGGLGDQNTVWSTMDLFRWSSPGVRDFTDGRDGMTTHFSINGTTVSDLAFNNQYLFSGAQSNSGDTADFVDPDVFGTGFPGETEVLSPTDISIMNALGWTSQPPPTPTPVPVPTPTPVPVPTPTPVPVPTPTPVPVPTPTPVPVPTPTPVPVPTPTPVPVPTPTPVPVPTPTPTPNSGILVTDTTTGQPIPAVGQPYTGPVVGLTSEYINITPDSLNVTATTPNWFIHTGSGEDAIAANSGVNVLDGGTGSNFLTGGSGTDTFFVDDRGPSADIWSTVNNFHAGDAATIWGVTPKDFNLAWVDGQGAPGHAGLTLHATAPGVPTASLTLAGLTSADLSNGKLSVSFGATADSSYMYIHAN